MVTADGVCIVECIAVFMRDNSTKIFRRNEDAAISLVAKIIHAKKIIKNQGVFDWLRGDKGTRLRVDAYFPNEKLVLEYHGAQHFKPNKLMDRRGGRFEQRKKYTQLRQKLIPVHGTKLLEIKYDESITKENIGKKLLKLGYKI